MCVGVWVGVEHVHVCWGVYTFDYMHTFVYAGHHDHMLLCPDLPLQVGSGSMCVVPDLLLQVIG